MVNYNLKKVLEISNLPKFKSANLKYIKKLFDTKKYNLIDMEVARVLIIEKALRTAAYRLTDNYYFRKI